MKLFGGGGGRRKTTHSELQREQKPSRSGDGTAPKASRSAAPTSGYSTESGRAASNGARGSTSNGARVSAPKPDKGRGAAYGKYKNTPAPKESKRKRGIFAMTVVILTVLIAVCAGAAAILLIHPPTVEQQNDPTINDTENGDAVDINSLLNSGQRIDDVFTFVVGAVDEDQTRTDALMVATMNIKEKTVNVMNIPRDTMCNNGERDTWRKINAAYGMKKGIEQTKKEIERLMGFLPDKYIIVNFDGIAAIVDAIGGVDYEVPFRMEYNDPSQNLTIDLYAGYQHLTGKQTVEFLRWRHNDDYSVQYPNGDEGRVENQQKFLKAVAKEVFQLKNVSKIKEIANAVFENVKTDFTAGELLWMGMQALQIDNSNIRFFTLPGYGQMSTAGGSVAYSFFFPYYNETLELVNKYFNPYSEPITTLDMVTGPESGSHSYTLDDSEDDYVWGTTSNYDYESDYSDNEGYDDDDSDGGYESGGESDSSGNSGNSNNSGGSGSSNNSGNSGGSSWNDRDEDWYYEDPEWYDDGGDGYEGGPDGSDGNSDNGGYEEPSGGDGGEDYSEPSGGDGGEDYSESSGDDGGDYSEPVSSDGGGDDYSGDDGGDVAVDPEA